MFPFDNNHNAAIDMAVAHHNRLALKFDGSLMAWGGYDEVIDNTPSGDGFVGIAPGIGFSLALHSDGSLVAWGDDTAGRVSQTPSGNNFVAVAAAGNFGLAIEEMAVPEPYSCVVWAGVFGLFVLTG